MELSSPVSQIPMVGPAYVKRLKKLEIDSVEDLLLHIPSRYKDYSKTTKIKDAKLSQTVTIVGKVLSIKNQYTRARKTIQVAQVGDKTGEIEVVWFNQRFLPRTIKKGAKVALSGKVEKKARGLKMVSPEYEKNPDKNSIHTGRLVPVYPETHGVSSKWLRSRINHCINLLEKIDGIGEFLPPKTLERNNLLSRKKAIKHVHFPESLQDAKLARRRLAFEELLYLQTTSQERRVLWETKKPSHSLKINKKEVNKFIDSLSFKLTTSQKKSTKEILADLGEGSPMNRLLQGDVGSGKTVVAAIAAFVAFLNGYQTVFMAPTQILAQQHYETLRKLFKDYKLRLALITSSDKKKDLGKLDIYVGTHALIQKKVDFDSVAVVVIDEQHKFGVEQRAILAKKAGKKNSAPHILTMTATPIPRTIALTLHGDLDISSLTELPKGRKDIKTWLVPNAKRASAYKWVEEQIFKKKTQAFVICPLIEESEAETMQQVRSATEEFERLKDIFPKLTLGLLHGRMKGDEKDKVMQGYKKGKIDILVSTPVVEVGIDVPNATIMIIETAERFGLAQLHQLRGRVGRGEKQSYCLLFAEKLSRIAKRRLTALTQKHSGVELANLDLKLRGPGEIFGKMQHGYRELKIASWKDTELIKATKKEAEQVVRYPARYKKYLAYIKPTLVSQN